MSKKKRERQRKREQEREGKIDKKKGARKRRKYREKKKQEGGGKDREKVGRQPYGLPGFYTADGPAYVLQNNRWFSRWFPWFPTEVMMVERTRHC